LRRALTLLLQLQFHPATEAAMELRQCLSVFFDVFTAASGEFRLQLVAAVLPAARQALHVVCKKNPAALLVKYVLQLLQASDSSEAKQQQQQPAAGEKTLATLLGWLLCVSADLSTATAASYLHHLCYTWFSQHMLLLSPLKHAVHALHYVFCVLHTGAASSLLGDSYDSLALQLLGEVEAGAPLIAAKVQPAKFKPYLSAVLKVSGGSSLCGSGACLHA
jgi:hypothetical protein